MRSILICLIGTSYISIRNIKPQPQAWHSVFIRQARQQGLIQYNRSRTTLLQNISKPRALFTRAHRHSDRTDFLQCEQHRNKFQAIANEHHYSLASAQSVPSKACSDSINLGIQLVVAPTLITTGQRLALRIASDGMLKHGVQRRWAIHKTAQHTITEVGFGTHRG